MIEEVKRNGYDWVLITPGGGSLLEVARSKRAHPRFQEIVQLNKTDVRDEELLALILYTGTDVQGDVRKWLRTPIDSGSLQQMLQVVTSGRWSWTVHNIRKAVKKLCEEPPEVL